jgi:2,4-dienoyl-CoA reductase-like NADH-dependent reductase (Old Yellow Enzyme family)
VDTTNPNEPCRDYKVDELVAEYYRQRATAGGLMISEGIAVNVEVCVPLMPFIPCFENTAADDS